MLPEGLPSEGGAVAGTAPQPMHGLPQGVGVHPAATQAAMQIPQTASAIVQGTDHDKVLGELLEDGGFLTARL